MLQGGLTLEGVPTTADADLQVGVRPLHALGKAGAKRSEEEGVVERVGSEKQAAVGGSEVVVERSEKAGSERNEASEEQETPGAVTGFSTESTDLTCQPPAAFVINVV